MSEKNYFDLTTTDVSVLRIQPENSFNCVLIDQNSIQYDGFILGKSDKGNAYTVCDIDFQKSATDDKYQPRLTFRRTNSEFETKPTRSDVSQQRISFHTGADGYREFWQMINFLMQFKDHVDNGEFREIYRVITDDQFKEYIKAKEQAGELIHSMDELDVDAAAAIQVASVLKILKSHKEKMNEFIVNGMTETDVQSWLDEEDHSLRHERAMIFGLEFIEHKREGAASGNRYDLLTRIGSQSKERVVIELKSPGDTIFNVRERDTINDPAHEYSLTDSLARAIPQILEYKRIMESKPAGDPDLERIGEKDQVIIAKCIIVIGAHQEDERWHQNLLSLRKSFNSTLEIWTYTDLLHKLEATISNLEMEQ